MARSLNNVIGFDDAPFERTHRGDVLIIGAVYSGARLEGVLSAKVRRDGANSTRVLAELVRGSRFFRHTQVILLQGIAFAGFNVVDLEELHRVLGIPVVTVARRRPNLAAIRRALLEQVPGGARKWRLVEKAGPMEPASGLHIQRAGLSLKQAESLLKRLQVNGLMPEPLRTAHLIAGGVILGESRHRP
ncbi:MAG: DUF99 family protein [Betaproteobacteria bacterium]|nr:DUF99 family protein [Betaproteobacteria bacterium]